MIINIQLWKKVLKMTFLTLIVIDTTDIIISLNYEAGTNKVTKHEENYKLIENNHNETLAEDSKNIGNETLAEGNFLGYFIGPADVLLCITLVFSNIIGIVGLDKDRPSLLIPWMILYMIGIISSFLAAPLSPLLHMIPIALKGVVFLVIWLIVFSLYKKMKEELKKTLSIQTDLGKKFSTKSVSCPNMMETIL